MFLSNRFVRVAVLSCACVFSAYAQNQTAPDNSANNKNQGTTAQQQSHAASDRQMTANIRKSLMADKSLSTYGHNVKIITQNGSVTLKGPVHSDDEKQAIKAHAEGIVGKGNVTDQLTVKQ
jgi:osmotically-inducible protein OsmY